MYRKEIPQIASSLLLVSLGTLPLMCIRERLRCTLSTIMGESTTKRRCLPLSSGQLYSPNAVFCEHGTKPEYWSICHLTIDMGGHPKTSRLRQHRRLNSPRDRVRLVLLGSLRREELENALGSLVSIQIPG